MKVLLVVHDFLPIARAGTEIYTYHLACELQKEGVSVELFFGEKGDELSVERRQYENLVCTVVRKPVKHFVNLFGEEDPWVDREFLKCLERFRPDVVHINHLLHLSTNIPKITKQHNIPVIFTLHDFWLRCPRYTCLDKNENLCKTTNIIKCVLCCRELYSRYQLYHSRPGIRGILDRSKSIVKMCLSIALEGYAAYRRMQLRERTMRSLAHGIDLWISPSKFLQEFMVAWGLPPEKVTFLPNGISGESFGQVREPRRNGHLRFAFIGGLTRQKGIHVLLEAFKGMRGASLVIYGLGNIHSYDDFKHVAAQGNVTYEGIMTEKEKPRILRMIDGLIVPSIWYENAPLVIQEAFIAGVPVICSNIGGMKEFVRDGQDGLHFKVGNSGDLRKALEKCIQNPSYLRGMNPLPRNFLSVEEHVSRLIPLYRRCVESKGHGKCLE